MKWFALVLVLWIAGSAFAGPPKKSIDDEVLEILKEKKKREQKQFRCGKTFITFHAAREAQGEKDLEFKLRTVRRVYIRGIQWTGPPYRAGAVIKEPEYKVYFLYLKYTGRDWYRLIECLD